MQLHWIDISIIFAYIAITLVIGFWVSNRATKDLKSYFLGGNTLPWYYLGVSDASGMFSVVLTELAQFAVMFIASIAVGIIAINKVSPEMLNSVLPAGWKNPFFGWNLDLEWSGILDSVNAKIAADGYSLFAIFWGVMVSMAGPAPNYDMQRILSTRSPKEAAKMNGLFRSCSSSRAICWLPG